MSVYQKRLHEQLILKKLQANGGVIVEGPRFVGKSTTALKLAKSNVRLDKDPKFIQTAELAPEALLAGDTPRLIDEWQLAPGLWNLVRHEIDDRQKPGQFILTGSATPSDDITRHSGAGRIGRVKMRPLTLSEMERSTKSINFADLFNKETKEIASAYGGLDISEYFDEVIRGGWPALFKETVANATLALEDYVDNISRVDLQKLEDKISPLRVSRLMEAIARNISTECVIEKLAKEAEISANETVHKYLEQLERIFILEQLPVWSNHIRSSIKMRVKPKLHFVDPSIAASLMGASTKILLSDLPAAGFYFESLAIRDLRIYTDILGGKTSFYRDSSDLEIDAIVQLRDGRWSAFEIKLGGKDNIASGIRSLEQLTHRLSNQKLSDLMSLNVITGGELSYHDKATGVNVVSLGHLYV